MMAKGPVSKPIGQKSTIGMHPKVGTSNTLHLRPFYSCFAAEHLTQVQQTDDVFGQASRAQQVCKTCCRCACTTALKCTATRFRNQQAPNETRLTVVTGDWQRVV